MSNIQNDFRKGFDALAAPYLARLQAMNLSGPIKIALEMWSVGTNAGQSEYRIYAEGVAVDAHDLDECMRKYLEAAATKVDKMQLELRALRTEIDKLRGFGPTGVIDAVAVEGCKVTTQTIHP